MKCLITILYSLPVIDYNYIFCLCYLVGISGNTTHWGLSHQALSRCTETWHIRLATSPKGMQMSRGSILGKMLELYCSLVNIWK